MTDFNDGVKALEFLKKMKEKHTQRCATQKIITIHRTQVSENNPAVAQLHIEFPDIQDGVKDYYNQAFTKFPLDADVHELRQINPQKYVMEIRSVKLMYTWFEYFINNFKTDFEGKGYKIEVTGFWDKYD
jgi:hypothetical protein